MNKGKTAINRLNEPITSKDLFNKYWFESRETGEPFSKTGLSILEYGLSVKKDSGNIQKRSKAYIDKFSIRPCIKFKLDEFKDI